MSKLNELIKQYCPNGIEYKKLEKLCNILDNGRKPVTKGSRINGEFPYYGANGIQDYVSDYLFDGIFVLVGEDGSVVDEYGHPIVHWVEGKVWVNNHAHIISENKECNLRYLYHALQNANVSSLIHGNIPKLNQGDFRNIEIPVPPLPVQQEIVRILDEYTAVTEKLKSDLNAELSARKLQYSYYRNKLLTFGDVVERTTLSEIGKVCMCKRIMKNETSSQGDIPFYKIGTFGGTPNAFISKETFDDYKNKYSYPKKGDILISAAGTIGRTVVFDGKPAYFQDSNIVWIANDESKALNTYLNYIYQTSPWNISTGGTIARLYNDNIANAVIPLPSLEKQKEIVEKLDVFSEITSDLEKGLPKEIELRTKQYEYYRDKLLNFKRKDDA